ncbi:LysR family transcriptional regulator [Myxococcota bacterium]|nr:LysR family transcriptional regulator [Myxococcota bacterium]
MQKTQIEQLSFRELRALQLLLEERNLTRASERLGLSQSATSRLLGHLRTVFQDPLFVRTSNGLLPTPRAEDLFAPLQRMFQAGEELIAPAQFDPARVRETFEIRASDYVSTVFLLERLQRIQREAPLMSVRVLHLDFRRADLLESGEVDVFFGGTLKDGGSLMQRKVFEDEYVCVFRSGHPLSEKASLALEDYLHYPHINVRVRGTPSSPVDDSLKEADAPPRHVGLVVQSYILQWMTLQDSDMIATIPRRLVERMCVYAPLLSRPLPVEVPAISIAMFWPERLTNAPLHRWFRSMLLA